MTNHALLNNVQHKDLQIITRRGAEFGDSVMAALTFPSEFRDIQAYYPIVFRQGENGVGFEPLALLGFQDNENLFLGPDGWDAPYIPMVMERQPFLIGVNGDQLLVHVDLDDARVTKSGGEPVFLPHGGNTEYLDRISETLFAMHQGFQSTKGFVAALEKYALLESFVADVTLNDGSQNRLVGFYTIHEERLNALDGAVIAELHQAGYLQAIYMVLASMLNFRPLIDRKNRAHAGQA